MVVVAIVYRTGTLELELADFKAAHRYRIVAVDSDVVAMADVPLNTWPAVVVLAPKDARLLSQFEALGRAAAVNEIRVLGFTSAGHNITSVTAVIDGGAPVELVHVYRQRQCASTPEATVHGRTWTLR